MNRSFIFGALFGVLTATGGYLVGKSSPQERATVEGSPSASTAVVPAASVADTPFSRIETNASQGSTGAQLEGGHNSRNAIEKEVALLRKDVDALSRALRGRADGEQVGNLAETDADQPVQTPTKTETLANLMAVGFAPERAESLKARLDKFSLERLALVDRASREKWINSERYRDELTKINDDENGMRRELGDTDYDRLLYAMGESNRVLVQEVMVGSVSAGADLRPGDTILSYDNKRIFDFSELRSATLEGLAGELVPVTIVRDDATNIVYLPRGPLGVRLDATRVLP